MAAPLSPQAYVKFGFMGPQNHCVGKHPDAMITDFKALRVNTHDALHCVAMYCGTQEFIKHMGLNKMYISD
jgi:hypothetical protein